jgi:hypothetical protein
VADLVDDGDFGDDKTTNVLRVTTRTYLRYRLNDLGFLPSLTVAMADDRVELVGVSADRLLRRGRATTNNGVSFRSSP